MTPLTPACLPPPLSPFTLKLRALVHIRTNRHFWLDRPFAHLSVGGEVSCSGISPLLCCSFFLFPLDFPSQAVPQTWARIAMAWATASRPMQFSLSIWSPRQQASHFPGDRSGNSHSPPPSTARAPQPPLPNTRTAARISC